MQGTAPSDPQILASFICEAGAMISPLWKWGHVCIVTSVQGQGFTCDTSAHFVSMSPCAWLLMFHKGAYSGLLCFTSWRHMSVILLMFSFFFLPLGCMWIILICLYVNTGHFGSSWYNRDQYFDAKTFWNPCMFFSKCVFSLNFLKTSPTVLNEVFIK